jgi:hypothetical protein
LAYLGNRPAESFASFEKQVFTIVNSQTAYTLSHSVVNENDIRLVINNVVQEPGSGKAYTASGTTLTLSAALTNGTDTMYCVFLGRALQTVNAPNASVGSDQTAPTIITGQTAETSIATDDTILIHDTSASALRKMTRANFVSGIGGTNTPAFSAYLGSSQTINDATDTKINFDTEDYDTASAYSTTDKRFTVPSGQAGKYFFYARIRFSQSDHNEQYVLNFRKNGSEVAKKLLYGGSGTKIFHSGYFVGFDLSCTETLAVGDYIEAWAKADNVSGNNITIKNDSTQSEFLGYKLIGV